MSARAEHRKDASLRYQGRHRQVALQRRRITTIAAATATALVAPLVVSAPVASAAPSQKAIDILARFTPPDGRLDPVLAALAAGTITTEVPPLAVGQIVPEPVQNGYVITGADLDGFDVTHTAEGQAEIAAFINRLRDRGDPVGDPTAYRVFSLPDVVTAEQANHGLPEGTHNYIRDDVEQLLAVILDSEFRDWIAQHLDLPTIDTLAGMVSSRVDDLIATIYSIDPSDDIAAIWSAVAALQAEVETLLGYLLSVDPLAIAGDVVDMLAPATRLLYEVLAFIQTFDPNDAVDSAPLDTTEVDALTDGDSEGPLSSALVLPACAPRPELVAAVLDGADVVLKTTMVATPTLGSVDVPCDIPQPSRMVSNADGPTYDSDAWSPAGGMCWHRKSNGSAWYDPCYWWYHRSNDGNADRDTYALNQYGTGKGKGVYDLVSLEVQSWRDKGSPDQDWNDWSPKSDQDAGNCVSKAVGVNVNAAYIEKSATLCEKWDIAKGEHPADFANRWHGSVERSERETAMFIATSVPNGYVPKDIVDYDYRAQAEPW